MTHYSRLYLTPKEEETLDKAFMARAILSWTKCERGELGVGLGYVNKERAIEYIGRKLVRTWGVVPHEVEKQVALVSIPLLLALIPVYFSLWFLLVSLPVAFIATAVMDNKLLAAIKYKLYLELVDDGRKFYWQALIMAKRFGFNPELLRSRHALDNPVSYGNLTNYIKHADPLACRLVLHRAAQLQYQYGYSVACAFVKDNDRVVPWGEFPYDPSLDRPKHTPNTSKSSSRSTSNDDDYESSSYSSGTNSGSSSGSYSSDDDDYYHHNSTPSVNPSNGMPMIEGTYMDVTGHNYGM